jgi:hypothetical protein
MTLKSNQLLTCRTLQPLKFLPICAVGKMYLDEKVTYFLSICYHGGHRGLNILLLAECGHRIEHPIATG